MNLFPRRLVALAAGSLFLIPAAMAQSFVPNTLVVSRTVYEGTAATVSVGQILSGGKAAVADGSFPNVFKNEVPDPSFGVSSAIYLDQLNLTGTRLSTLAIDSSQVTSSFASKSELALNVSTDGRAITFMGYKAALNQLDVSNSNTAAVVDATNPVKSSAQRAVVQVDLSSGNVSITGVDAYSGNNGRAAVLANGNYYMVGNSGNGSGDGTTLSKLSDNTGVQRIAVGSSGATTAVGVAIGTYGSTTGYQRGFSIAQLSDPTKPGQNYAADKTGKDDNFRGMTVFNDTLYVTKGSGGNGVNTVYQVGAVGALANGGTISNAAITVLPGFSTVAASSSSASHPFGLWFANATTLFVADEGDGVRSLAPKNSTVAGLDEFKLVNGSWAQVANFQKGLTDQATYTAGLPWAVKTDGLRNLTGSANADGSFTLYATTSTVSDETTHDLGADPNQIVSITVGANSTGANTSFTVLQSAAAGERFGGVALTPAALAAPVPEPASYALMLAGLLSVGAIVRRRKA